MNSLDTEGAQFCYGQYRCVGHRPPYDSIWT